MGGEERGARGDCVGQIEEGGWVEGEKRRGDCVGRVEREGGWKNGERRRGGWVGGWKKQKKRGGGGLCVALCFASSPTSPFPIYHSDVSFIYVSIGNLFLSFF